MPATVKVYKQVVNDGLDMTLGDGLVMERRIMAHVNNAVSGDAIGQRRSGVQQRGQSQKS